MMRIKDMRLWGFIALIGIQFSVIAGPNHAEKVIAEDLFVQEQIPNLQIDLSRSAMDRLRQAPRVYVQGTIREGNITYTNVSIRLKGGPGSFRRFDDQKPAFTINFEREAPGQKFHGLKKIHLNNSVQDHTFLGEKISRELFEAAGVPAPRAGHATVQLNDRSLGFYVLIEGINKQFLHRYFKNANGNVYDGHSQSEVTRRMRTNSGENRRDETRLGLLAQAAQEPDLEVRLTKLNQLLDIDRFISFLATEIMICHWDGYALNRNNFRIYDDLDSGRFVFLSQGTDQVFQRAQSAVFPQPVGLVARSVLEVPELRERYRNRMIQLLTNVYDATAIRAHLNDVAAKIQPHLQESEPQAAANYPAQVRTFCNRIQQRIRILQGQLLSTTSDADFDKGGVLKLTGWQPKIDLGTAVLNSTQTNEAGPLLYINLTEPAAASWRTQIQLERGNYQFVGRMRLADVKLDGQDVKGGAGLRISRRKFSRLLSGDLPWATVSFPFTVGQDHAEVELVCELRALQGQAWFDPKSLRVVRLTGE